MDKFTKFKLSIMKSLQDDEERQLQKELLGSLIEFDTPEEIAAPMLSERPVNEMKAIEAAPVAMIEAPVASLPAEPIAPVLADPGASDLFQKFPSVNKPSEADASKPVT